VDKALALALKAQRENLVNFKYWVKGMEAYQRGVLLSQCVDLTARLEMLEGNPAKKEDPKL